MTSSLEAKPDHPPPGGQLFGQRIQRSNLNTPVPLFVPDVKSMSSAHVKACTCILISYVNLYHPRCCCSAIQNRLSVCPRSESHTDYCQRFTTSFGKAGGICGRRYTLFQSRQPVNTNPIYTCCRSTPIAEDFHYYCLA